MNKDNRNPLKAPQDEALPVIAEFDEESEQDPPVTAHRLGYPANQAPELAEMDDDADSQPDGEPLFPPESERKTVSLSKSKFDIFSKDQTHDDISQESITQEFGIESILSNLGAEAAPKHPPVETSSTSEPSASTHHDPISTAYLSPEPVYESGQSDDPSFERKAGEPKLGIIGGKGVGKSYLFQAMVARSFNTDKAGSLSYYLAPQGIRLHTAVNRNDPASLLNLLRFVEHYNEWKRIAQTLADTQRWYRLSLPYRTGILGRGHATLDVEFFEASGEGLLELEYMGKEELELWKDAYLDATVMVFCLPLWAAFPRPDLSEDDWQTREKIIRGFHQVLHNYDKLREKNKCDNPVRAILALTMADDTRTKLSALRDRWITSYLDAPDSYLSELAKGHGVARYMANARKISDYVRLEFTKISDTRVRGIPNLLNFKGGQPWFIPLSAVEGKTLDNIERDHSEHHFQGRFDPPVPVHVELPLLVALCERENALM